MAGDELPRIHHPTAIRGLGNALTDDADGASPVSHLNEVGRLPSDMRLGPFALGVLGYLFTLEHDRIVGLAENAVTNTIAGLHEHRERLHSVAGNIEIAEARNEEHVRRI